MAKTREEIKAKFVKLFGEIGQIYDEDTWLSRFGVYASGWQDSRDHAKEMGLVDAGMAKDRVGKAIMDWNLSDGLPYLNEDALMDLQFYLDNAVKVARRNNENLNHQIEQL